MPKRKGPKLSNPALAQKVNVDPSGFTTTTRYRKILAKRVRGYTHKGTEKKYWENRL